LPGVPEKPGAGITGLRVPAARTPQRRICVKRGVSVDSTPNLCCGYNWISAPTKGYGVLSGRVYLCPVPIVPPSTRIGKGVWGEIPQAHVARGVSLPLTWIRVRTGGSQWHKHYHGTPATGANRLVNRGQGLQWPSRAVCHNGKLAPRPTGKASVHGHTRGEPQNSAAMIRGN
jgi:hypothetical protein